MDLNDLRFFALIVEHGGFSAAERASKITKSKLSRRVALLEDRLGARLLQRSTRRLALTEAGRVFYEHCAAMVIEADAAQQAVDLLRSEPSGNVRMTCPTAIVQFYVARLVSEFMRRYPKVRIELDSSDRTVNLIEERIDVALRARDSGLHDPGLTARRIASGRLVLVASAEYMKDRPMIDEPALLAGFDTIGITHEGAEQRWSLVSRDGKPVKVANRPRLLCSDMTVEYQAMLNGVGIALLPLRVVWRGLEDGSLVRIAKDWATPEQDIHLVFANRRGMLPSVRALIDFLVERIPTALG
jgi:DNA-binding transcriptional LysR family regulator